MCICFVIIYSCICKPHLVGCYITNEQYKYEHFAIDKYYVTKSILEKTYQPNIAMVLTGN